MRINAWILCLIMSFAVVATADAQGRGGRGRGGGMGRNSIFSLANNEAVQKELNVSVEDAAKLKSISDDFGEAVREGMSGSGGNFQDMTDAERAKLREKGQEVTKAETEKFLPKLKSALTADQFTRLQQIHWQNLGAAAYVEPEVVKALSVSTEQQDKVKAIVTDFNTKMFAGFGGGGGGGGDREAFREKMQTLTKERDTKGNEVLTKEQLDKFASLKGKDFDLSQLRGGGPGGGGGGGGRGKRPQPKAE